MSECTMTLVNTTVSIELRLSAWLRWNLIVAAMWPSEKLVVKLTKATIHVEEETK